VFRNRIGLYKIKDNSTYYTIPCIDLEYNILVTGPFHKQQQERPQSRTILAKLDACTVPSFPPNMPLKAMVDGVLNI
jgi:hypothetical protein